MLPLPSQSASPEPFRPSQQRHAYRDLTNSVFEDMIIPVFYDPTNPDRNTTPCATCLKVSTNPI